jgi:hypothetical protein
MTGKYVMEWELHSHDNKYRARVRPVDEWYKLPVRYRSDSRRGCFEFEARDELEAYTHALYLEEQLNNER